MNHQPLGTYRFFDQNPLRRILSFRVVLRSDTIRMLNYKALRYHNLKMNAPKWLRLLAGASRLKAGSSAYVTREQDVRRMGFLPLVGMTHNLKLRLLAGEGGLEARAARLANVGVIAGRCLKHNGLDATCSGELRRASILPTTFTQIVCNLMGGCVSFE
jgi:hypothetical protein